MSIAPVPKYRGVEWLHRREKREPWLIAACPPHAAALKAFRFIEGSGADVVPAADFCAVCLNPKTLEDVQRCLCERAPSRCPVHRKFHAANRERTWLRRRP